MATYCGHCNGPVVYAMKEEEEDVYIIIIIEGDAKKLSVQLSRPRLRHGPSTPRP